MTDRDTQQTYGFNMIASHGTTSDGAKITSSENGGIVSDPFPDYGSETISSFSLPARGPSSPLPLNPVASNGLKVVLVESHLPRLRGSAASPSRFRVSALPKIRAVPPIVVPKDAKITEFVNSLQGYSVIDGNVLMQNDNGYKARIFDDAAFAAITMRPINSCEDKFVSQARSGTRGYYEELATKMTFKVEGWGASFSTSTAFKDISQRDEQERSEVIITSASCSDFETVLELFHDPPPKLSSGFISALSRLPGVGCLPVDTNLLARCLAKCGTGHDRWSNQCRRDCEPECDPQTIAWDALNDSERLEYYKFLDEFGTHVPNKMTYGARTSATSVMTMEAWQTMHQSEFDLTIAASASYWGVTASTEFSREEIKRQTATFESVDKHTIRSQTGSSMSDGAVEALLPPPGKDPTPVPIAMELQELSWLVRNHAQLKSLPETLLNNIDAALVNYCPAFRLQGYGVGRRVEKCLAPANEPSWLVDVPRPANMFIPQRRQSCPDGEYVTRIDFSSRSKSVGAVSIVGATCSDGSTIGPQFAEYGCHDDGRHDFRGSIHAAHGAGSLSVGGMTWGHSADHWARVRYLGLGSDETFMEANFAAAVQSDPSLVFKAVCPAGYKVAGWTYSTGCALDIHSVVCNRIAMPSSM